MLCIKKRGNLLVGRVFLCPEFFCVCSVHERSFSYEFKHFSGLVWSASYLLQCRGRAALLRKNERTDRAGNLRVLVASAKRLGTGPDG